MYITCTVFTIPNNMRGFGDFMAWERLYASIILISSFLYFQVKISFDDHATTTFEYEGEESALQNYLREHPEETDEVDKEVTNLSQAN